MTTSRRRISQAEIARLCGVSRSTVSLVLNGSPLVAEATRRKVQAVLDELDYRPNRMARALVGKSSGLLGALLISCGESAPAYHMGFLEGMLRAGTYRGTDLVVRGVTGQSGDVGGVADILAAFLADNPIDGLALVSGPDLEPADIAVLEDRGMPFVLLNKSIAGCRVPAIAIDNKQVMIAAVEHLLSLGHENLLYVHRPITASRNFAARLAGFWEACQTHKSSRCFALDIDKVDALRGPGFEIWWEQLEEPYSAILCTDTVLALAVQGALTRLGLQVPADVSLLSVGSSTADTQEAEAIQLTRFEIPVHDMGGEAVALLQKLIKDKDAEEGERLIQPRFVQGRSCVGK